MLANAVYIGVVTLNQRQADSPMVAPRLVAEGEGITVWDTFEKVFVEARKDQPLFTGSRVRTDADSQATITFNSDVLRLAPDTTVEYVANHFQDTSDSALIFRLESGKVWINAQDSLTLVTQQTAGLWSHASGSVGYAQSQNDLRVYSGVLDFTWYGKNREMVAQETIPMNTRLMITDQQVGLQTIQGVQVDAADKTDEWVVANARQDDTSNKIKDINSAPPGSNTWIGKVGTWINYITFWKPKKETRSVQNMVTLIQSAAHAENAKVKGVLADLEREWNGDINPLMRDKIATEQFYALQPFVFFDASARQTVAFLRDKLEQKSSNTLRLSRLTEVNEWLRRGNVEEAKEAVHGWSAGWNVNFQYRSPKSLEQEFQVLKSVILGNVPRLNGALLDEVAAVSEMRIRISQKSPQAIQALVEDQAEIGNALVQNYRYSLAKRYLQKGSNALSTETDEVMLAANATFKEATKNTLQRIDYAEKVLHGAAEPIDEADFDQYLRFDQKSQANIAEILAPVSRQETVALETDVSDAMRKLSLAGVRLVQADIQPNPSFPNTYSIHKAHWVNPFTQKMIRLRAEYDLKKEAIFQVEVDGQKVVGSYLLKDFIRILQSENSDEEIEPNPITPEDLKVQDQKRAQILNQDLALLYVMSDLRENGIGIVDKSQITMLDQQGVRFRIQQGLLSANHPRTGEPLEIDFEYDSENQLLSHISIPKQNTLFFQSFDLKEAVQEIARQLVNH